jgi:hypothetical protein
MVEQGRLLERLYRDPAAGDQTIDIHGAFLLAEIVRYDLHRRLVG